MHSIGFFFDNSWGPFVQTHVGWTIPLYTFNKISYGVEATTEGVAAKKAEIDGRRWEVITQVKTLYYGWLLVDEMDSLGDEIQGHLDRANKYLEEHLASGSSDINPIDRLKIKTYTVDLKSQRIEVRK